MKTYFAIAQFIYLYTQKEHQQYGHRTGLTNQLKTIIAAQFGITLSITKIKYLQKLFNFFPFGVTHPNNQLTWCHYTELLKTKDPDEARFYQQMAIKENLSVRKIRHLMKSKLYYKVATTAHLLNSLPFLSPAKASATEGTRQSLSDGGPS